MAQVRQLKQANRVLRKENKELRSEVEQLKGELAELKHLPIGASNNKSISTHRREAGPHRESNSFVTCQHFLDMIRIIVPATYFCKMLDFTSLLNLAQGCRSLQSLLYNEICDNCKVESTLNVRKQYYQQVKHMTVATDNGYWAHNGFLNWSFPPHLVELKLQGNFRAESTYPRNLPPSLTTLFLHDDFNGKVDGLPIGLQKLVFGYRFNQPVDKLPSSLRELDFQECFNQPVNSLPTSLRRLSLHEQFTHPVDNLPPNLIKLEILGDFNRPVDHLPPNMIDLTIFGAFNHPVNNLPSTLVRLTLCEEFDHPVDHLPVGLQELCLGEMFDQVIHSLPNSLSTLELGAAFGDAVALPASLKALHCTELDGPIPQALAQCTSLQELHLRLFSGPLEHIPPFVQALWLNKSHPQFKIAKQLLPNLKSLYDGDVTYYY